MRTLASQLVAHVGAVATLLVVLHTGALRADENGTTRRATRERMP